MSDLESSGSCRGRNEKLDTMDPEREPEYVGAHSARTSPQCQHIHDANGPDEEFEPTQCRNWATHTVVMKDSGGLHQIAMCNDCGEPDDVTATDRKWSEEMTGETQRVIDDV